MEDLQLTIPDAIARLKDQEVRLPGRAFVRKAGTSQLAMDALSEPAIDEMKLTVRMRISTEDIDRDGHVLIQAGGRYDNYRENPCVLLEHGEEYKLAVAMSETPDKQLAISLEQDGTYGVAHHTNSNEMSMQIFDMVVCGLVRACSIGFDPFAAFVKYIEGEEILHFSDWDTLEWSYCAIGVNPKAIKKSRGSKNHEKLLESWALQCDAASRILQRGTLDGRPILPALRKSFSGLLVPQGNIVTGFDPTEKTMKKLSKQEVKALGAKGLLKAMTELKSYDEETQKAITEEASSKAEDMTPAPGEEVETEEVETESDSMPLGAKVTAAIHSQLQQLLANAESAMSPVENPEIKGKLDEELAKLRESIASLEGVFATVYSELPPLSVEVTADEEQVKSFLAANPRSAFQLTGHAARIGQLLKSFAGKVTPAQLKALQNTAADLRKIGQAAASYKPTDTVDAAQFKKVTDYVDRLEAKVKSLFEKLEQTPA
jgi:hypothetical protein